MQNRYLILMAISFLGFFLLLAGCGKDEKSSENNVTDEGPWFETKFHDFRLEENEIIPTLYVYGNDMYFLTYRVDEQARNVLMSLKKMSLDNYSIADLNSFSSAEDGQILNIYSDESGIYLMSQSIQWNSEYTKMLDAEYKIIVCEPDGTVKEKLDITEAIMDKGSEDEAVYVSDIVCDSEGNICVTDNATFVMAFDSDGRKIADINCDNWGNGFLRADNGTVYYSYTGTLTRKQSFAPVNIKADKLGKKVGELSSFMTFNYCIDADEAVWLSEENTLVTYNLKTKEKKKVLDWLDYDITVDSVRMLEVMEDGTIIVCIESMGQEQPVYEMAVFKESDEPLNEKTIITYATFGADAEIMEGIVRFNKNSEKYRIKVVDYYCEENYEDAWDEYNQAVLDEGFADIVNVGWSNYQMMAEKGLYADLSEFMNADEEINREDYFDNILSAYEVDGKLYAMPVSFTISTLMGKEKIWGDKDTLSLEDIKITVDSMSENAEIMEGMSQTDFVFLMLQGSLDKFIDWESGECYFNSDEFVEILYLSKKFPEKSGLDMFSGYTADKFRKDQVLLYDFELAGIDTYQMTKKLLGDEIRSVGYPGANGGLIQNSGSLFAISNESPHKDIAWEFIKSMISENYQTNYIYYYNPIHKGAFEKMTERAMEKEYYIDEKGKEVEKAKMSYILEDIEIDIYAATKAEVEEYKKIVEGATTLATYEQKIMVIVEEEAEAFFDNKKSAEEVAQIIQNRAKIYVNERS